MSGKRKVNIGRGSWTLPSLKGDRRPDVDAISLLVSPDAANHCGADRLDGSLK